MEYCNSKFYYRTLLVIISAGFSFLISCFVPDPNDPELIIFENGFEAIEGWTYAPELKLQHGDAHKGRYSVSVTPDSITKLFRLKFGQIGAKPMRVLRFSVWCKSDEIPVNGKVIIEVFDDTSHLMVNEYRIDKILLNKGEWSEMRGHIDLYWRNINGPDHDFILSVSNDGKDPILVDDVRLEFSID